ncbi:MAG: UDP-N-acetylmuramoyl-tripeptide--D-alanyl-D-alanine ligase [Methylophaga sp.]|nr:MAG: UDP-N-acetylmuramoyl-tripeptide--D-alanyl-D-alanine ligase [Methylophaga sp.]
MAIYLAELATLLGCKVPTNDVVVMGTAIDSRKIAVNSLFVALKGDSVDGHDYIASARQAGACAALVSSQQNDVLPQLVVADVVKAFAQIACYWRQQYSAKVVAITGSNGKTTVKEMVAAITKQCGTVIATQGNLNNELGVPLTLTRLNDAVDYAVIEMGANHAGEIAGLVAMAVADVALINNIGAAHIEGFGSINGVAKAKAEIYAGLTQHAIAVVNNDMSFVDSWQAELAGKQIISFALENDADITAQNLQLDPDASHFMVKLDDEFHHINLPLPGLHNVANALAAISVTKALDIAPAAMVKGLSLMASVPHRLQLRTGVNGSHLLDDSYNANPSSYQPALQALMAFHSQHWLVLGDFAELGKESEAIHYQMGLDAKESGITRLWTIGVQSRNASEAYGEGAQHFDTMDELKKQLKTELTEDVTCLIKGSRFMQLDKLADALAVVGEH